MTPKFEYSSRPRASGPTTSTLALNAGSNTGFQASGPAKENETMGLNAR